MSTTSAPADQPVDRLVNAAEQLNTDELDRFAQCIVALRARRHAPHLAASEADLLLEIDRGLPPETRSRFNQLIRRRDAKRLTSAEHQELLRLTDEIERFDAKRASLLADLARLRGITLSALMDQLGATPPPHGR
jgi:hypothetical protein